MDETRIAALKTLAKKIAETDAALWTTIQDISKEVDVKTSEVMDRFESIYSADYLSQYPEKERIAHAVRITKIQYMASLQVQAIPHTFVVLDRMDARTIKRTSGDKAGTKMTIANIIGWGKPEQVEGRPIPKDGLVRIALFEERSKQVETVEVGRTYTADLTGGLQDGIYVCSTTDTTRFEPTPDPPADVAALLEQHFPLTPLSDLSSHIAKNEGDYRLFKGAVTYAQSRPGKSGNMFGRYSLVDPTMPISAARNPNSGVSCMVDPSQVRWNQGSELLVLGRVEAGREQYGPSIRGEVVAPVFGLPYHPQDGGGQNGETVSEGKDVTNKPAVAFDF